MQSCSVKWLHSPADCSQKGCGSGKPVGFSSWATRIIRTPKRWPLNRTLQLLTNHHVYPLNPQKLPKTAGDSVRQLFRHDEESLCGQSGFWQGEGEREGWTPGIQVTKKLSWWKNVFCFFWDYEIWRCTKISKRVTKAFVPFASLEDAKLACWNENKLDKKSQFVF